MLVEFRKVYRAEVFLNNLVLPLIKVSLVVQTVKNLPAMWEAWVQSLGWEDPLDKEIATHPSILA